MDDQKVQIIVAILIGIGYVVVSAIKKIDSWIQEHRMPPEYRNKRPQTAQPAAREEAERPKNLGDLLREELEKALAGTEAPPSSEPVYAEPARQVPIAVKPAHSQRPARAPMGGRKTAMAYQSEGASVVLKRTRHLAIMRTFSDAKDAIVLHEIFQPPVSLRRQQRGFARRPNAL